MEDSESDLKFDAKVECEAETEKRTKIEQALKESANTPPSMWCKFATDKYGLVGDDLRKEIWPRLLNLDPNQSDTGVPTLKELLQETPESNQVVLDVKRSLNRFPPGIPIKKRLELQDELTVLILRVIKTHPELSYYQGYHDVAVTVLLVAGSGFAFRIMEHLSLNHLRECMESTMASTNKRLMYVYEILDREDKKLHDFLFHAQLGTMFALPWYITWFGHSLGRYEHVVRLYDFFLASPTFMPLYLAVALVQSRRSEILTLDGSDMGDIHMLLSHIPDDIDVENLVCIASQLYNKHSPKDLEDAVEQRSKREEEQNKRRREVAKRRAASRNRPLDKMRRKLINVMGRRGGIFGLLFFAASLVVGYYAYYLKQNEFSLQSITSSAYR